MKKIKKKRKKYVWIQDAIHLNYKKLAMTLNVDALFSESSSQSGDEGVLTNGGQSESVTLGQSTRGDDLLLEDSEVTVSVSRTDSGMALIGTRPSVYPIDELNESTMQGPSPKYITSEDQVDGAADLKMRADLESTSTFEVTEINYSDTKASSEQESSSGEDVDQDDEDVDNVIKELAKKALAAQAATSARVAQIYADAVTLKKLTEEESMKI